MDRERIAKRIVDLGAVAVLRAHDSINWEPVMEALVAGGVRALEITLTTPDALPSLTRMRKQAGEDVILGAGSVITAEAAQTAVDCGAQFLVSPITRESVIQTAHANGVPAMPGVLTPTEAQRAHELGADLIKVFPAAQLGSSHIKALMAPLPHLRLVPTGGVTPENAGEWLRAGAAAVGIGTALVDRTAIHNGRMSILTERAMVLCNSIARARNTHTLP